MSAALTVAFGTELVVGLEFAVGKVSDEEEREHESGFALNYVELLQVG